MKYNKITYKNKNLKRVSYTKIKNIINNCSKYEGLTIYMLPVNFNPDSYFVNGFFEIDIEKKIYMDTVDYYNYINECIYYNCNKEAGSYLKFYLEDGIL